MRPIDYQDAAALYCALRDGICDVQALTWRQRLMDFLFPERAARRRLDAIERVYAAWQAERTEQPVEDVSPVVRMNDGTLLAIMSVRAQLKRNYDEHDDAAHATSIAG